MSTSHTLNRSCSLEGIGIHTGATVRVAMTPAPVGRGRVFVRDGVEIPARAEFVVDTRRCTTLGRDGVSISTVEHLLAALALAGVDDAEIHVDGPELPALDGAATHWLAAIREAGIRARDGESSSVRIVAPHWLALEGAEFFLAPADELRLYAAIDIPDTTVRHAMAGGLIGDPAINEQLARARTWAQHHEVQALLDAGLARGGTLDNCLVLTADGFLNDQVWPDEPAWHKALDFLGDLALLGSRLCGQVIAVRAGHRHHVQLVNYLRTGWNNPSEGVK